MADEGQKTVDEIERTKKESSSILRMVLIWTGIFVFQIVVLYFLFSKVFAPKYLPAIEPENGKMTEGKSSSEIGEIFLIEDIIANPKNTGAMRIVNVTVGLEYKDSSVLRELEKRDIQIRDYLISFFGDRTISQLDDVADKDSLRKTIHQNLNMIIPDNGIKSVYFSNFIIQ